MIVSEKANHNRSKNQCKNPGLPVTGDNGDLAKKAGRAHLLGKVHKSGMITLSCHELADTGSDCVKTAFLLVIYLAKGCKINITLSH